MIIGRKFSKYLPQYVGNKSQFLDKLTKLCFIRLCESCYFNIRYKFFLWYRLVKLKYPIALPSARKYFVCERHDVACSMLEAQDEGKATRITMQYPTAPRQPSARPRSSRKPCQNPRRFDPPPAQRNHTQPTQTPTPPPPPNQPPAPPPLLLPWAPPPATPLLLLPRLLAPTGPHLPSGLPKPPPTHRRSPMRRRWPRRRWTTSTSRAPSPSRRSSARPLVSPRRRLLSTALV
jgi:hypothetical protein